MIGTQEACAKVRKVFERRFPQWAKERFAFEVCACTDAGGDNELRPGVECCIPYEKPSYTLGLQPPTEKEALEDVGAARAWTREWRAFGGVAWVEFEQRTWPSLGKQTVPVRLSAPDPCAIAVLVGERARWDVCCERVCEMTRRFAPRLSVASRAAMGDAVRQNARALTDLPADDWARLANVLEWLISHPDASVYARQIPVRGVDTKWVEGHRRLVFSFARAALGHEPLLQLRGPSLVQVRMLDARLAVCGMTSFAASVVELGRLTGTPRQVIVCENLVTMLTLPSLPDTMAVFGEGFAADRLAGIPWLHDVRLLYWGDLDSNGFAILNMVRHSFSDAESVMMDEPTLDAHLDLCVAEGEPFLGTLDRLTPQEQKTLSRLLAENPPLRLEQERIGWDYANDKLASLATTL